MDILKNLTLPARFAVMLNGQVLPKGQYAEKALKPEDRVEIISAVGGG